MPIDPADENGGSLPLPEAAVATAAQGPPPSSPSPPRSSDASPSSPSLIVARGRSRIRRISSDADPFSEENLRKRYVFLAYPGVQPLLIASGQTYRNETRCCCCCCRCFILFFFHAVAIIASNRLTRHFTSRSDGNSCARWALERTAL
jgi:hypothetical protein